MKRSIPGEGSGSPKDDAEMDVDDEEKGEAEEVAPDEGEADGEEEAGTTQNPFLDSFYGISSPNATERAQAGRVMLHHSLVGPDANSKDAAYALRRLMNGLCSGRAAARQGNASALASFLKAAFTLGKMEAIQNESRKEEEKELSNLAFVRQRLHASTEPGESQGKRKGSEERDYQFGRLFGINAVVRSSILLPIGEDATAELDDIIQATSGYVEDLADLYSYKKWMREPAAHAVVTMLNTFYSLCPGNADAQKVVEHLVENVVIPRLLSKGVADDSNVPLFATYTAEQIAIAVNIQTHSHLHSQELSSPINRPILTTETVPVIASALSGTSAVLQPRTHLVWDTIWSFITETDDTVTLANVNYRKIRKSCPLSGESIDDLLGTLLKHVVIERLLRLDETTQGSEKATDDRRALALCLIRNLSGVEFMSSLTARTKLVLEPEILESQVFRPLFVRTLFLDVICRGGRSPHVLKPLALHVLDASSQALFETNDTVTTDQNMAKRLAIIKALLRCEPHFDSRTKTSTVDTLLGLNIDNTGKNIPLSLWEEYIAFLQCQIVAAEPAVENSNAKGYVDVLFHFGKQLLKIDLGDGADVVEFKVRAMKRIFALLMTIAFFDCSAVPADTAPALKYKKSKKVSSTSKSSTVADIAAMVKEARAGATSTFPYEVRSLASARFFSFVAESVTLAAHSSDTNRATRILELLSGLDEMRKQLLHTGATQLGAVNTIDQMDTDEESPESITAKLCKDALNPSADTGDGKISRTRIRWVSGCAILASALHLHLLSPIGAVGDPEDDDPNADADEDYEEIVSNIEDVHHVANLYSTGSTADDHPLAALAELCTNILSSPLGMGNQSRGASPTLLREVVKFAWTGGLCFSSVQSEESALDSHVVSVLLNAIGAINGRSTHEEGEEEDVESDDAGDVSSENDSNDGIFAKAIDVLDVRDEKMSEKDIKKPFIDEEDDGDLEIDPSRLQSMLEGESDADIDEGELEHHEGADAALAKLIQMKQDARKAGQLARERTEIARQLRCIPLLETLFVGRVETWGSLLRVDIVLQIVFPILQYRRKIVNSIEKGAEKGSNSAATEKRALVSRLTSLVKAKALKAKVPDFKWSESISISEFTSDFAAKLVQEGKSSVDKDHQTLCNSTLLMMLRAVPGAEMKLQKAELYGAAVMEWATKRASHLETACFEDLIHHYPVLAQGCLVTALASAASTARSSFLKSESFRLLSLLYNPKLNPNTSELDKLALERMANATDLVFVSVASCLKDAEMRKAKRLREVLKMAEKVVVFLAASPISFSLDKERLGVIIDMLKKLKGDSESQGIQKSSEKLAKDIGDLLTEKPLVNESAVEDKDDQSNSGTQPKKSDVSKKKKHKSKKKRK